MADGPYTRIYYTLADEYPDLFDSPDLACYVRLLIAAEQAWPSKARWAGYVDEDQMARLEATELVVRDGKRYTVKGLDKERRKRSRHASRAARARYEQPTQQEASTALSRLVSTAPSTAPSSAQVLPRRDETSRDETSRDETKRVKPDEKRRLTPLKEVLSNG